MQKDTNLKELLKEAQRAKRRKRRRDILLNIRYRKIGTSNKENRKKFIRDEKYIERIYKKYNLKYRTLSQIESITDDRLRQHALNIRKLVESGKYKAYKRDIFYQNFDKMLDTIKDRSGLTEKIEWIKEQIPRLTIRSLNRLVLNVSSDIETYSAELQTERDEAEIDNIIEHIKSYIEVYGYRK